MSNVQNAEAQNLLRLISSSVKQDRLLTYKSAAALLGRKPPEDHSRAIAQMCDLLDAAAALAGVPLLALVAVRTSDGKINPKAWRQEPERREVIISTSKAHKFSGADFKAIARTLKTLDGMGNRAAWRHVYEHYSKDELIRRFRANLVKRKVERQMNALDDLDASELGTDSPDRAKTTGYTYVRDPKVRTAVKRRANGRCELCGALGFLKLNGERYLECHHIIALANQGADRMTNVIALCPNDHREAHCGERGEVLEIEMMQRLSAFQA